MNDLEGKKYGRLEVLGLAEIKEYVSSKNRQTKSYWVCDCSCGKSVVVRGEHLSYGKIKSCGCLAREVHSKRMAIAARTHGLSHTSVYKNYSSMIGRVFHPDELHKKYYTGITICERWLGEEGLHNFIEDMGVKPTDKHEIDRINPWGNYEPENCRWATRSEQMQNTRRKKV